MLRLKFEVIVVEPDDATADEDEVREAIEQAIADLGEVDVDAAESEDGTEIWTVDEVNVIYV